MRHSILVIALLFAGNMAFASTPSISKKLTVDKAIICFVKSLKPDAFNTRWVDGGKKEFTKKVKSNENYPVLGDQLGNLVSIYLSNAAFKSDVLAGKSSLAARAAEANKENTVAAMLWEIQQQINPAMITEKGQKMMSKWEPELKALAGKS